MNREADLIAPNPMHILFVKKHLTLFWLLYFISVLVGLYGSLKVVISLFGLESDTVHSIMLWYGVNSYGLTWLKDWIFTQDNWLLSLSPFHFLGFLLFGAKPVVVILGGWLIFVLSAFISGIIAWQLNAKRSAVLIPLTLLFLGLYAHSDGLISYSTSHNVTNLFGLATLLLLVKWAQKQNNTTLFLILLLLLAGAISDPWMVPVYNLPIVLVSIVLWLFPIIKINRIDCFKLFLTSASSILVAETQVFGALDFLPSMYFRLGSWDTINNNAILLIKDLGGLLNILPFHTSNDFIPAVFSIGIIATLLLVNIVKAARLNIFAETSYFVFFSFTLFSIGGIVLAFIGSEITGPTFSARFLMNCLYLIVIGLGVLIDLNWKRSTKNQRILFASVITLFFLSGIASTFPIWKTPGFAIKDMGTNNLIQFLRENNLSYGYGPFWGSLANAVTAVSKSEIRIRPVYFNRANGMMAGNRPESSRRWYLTEDVPSGQKEYFVFVKSDGEQCADVNLCIKGLAKQFGEPTRVLKYTDATILVWDHPLLGYQQTLKIVLGKAIDFDELNVPPTWPGWSAEKWGTWSYGDTASVILSLSSTPKNDLDLLIDGHAFLAVKHPSQEVDVIVNQHYIVTLKYDQLSNGGVRVVKIPKLLVLEKNGQLIIKFNFKNPKSPAELGLSGDVRRLGLGIVSLELRAEN